MNRIPNAGKSVMLGRKLLYLSAEDGLRVSFDRKWKLKFQGTESKQLRRQND